MRLIVASFLYIKIFKSYCNYSKKLDILYVIEFPLKKVTKGHIKNGILLPKKIP